MVKLIGFRTAKSSTNITLAGVFIFQRLLAYPAACPAGRRAVDKYVFRCANAQVQGQQGTVVGAIKSPFLVLEHFTFVGSAILESCRIYVHKLLVGAQ